MTIIAGYITGSGVLLGADSGYRKISEDVDINESDITDKIQQASENVVIAGMGYHYYMLFVQTGLAENIDEETSLKRINQLLVDFAREACDRAQEQSHTDDVPPSKLGFSIWIAGVRAESNGGFLSKINVNLTEADTQLEPTVHTEPGVYGINVGGVNNNIPELPEELHNKLVEKLGYLPFGRWFTGIVNYYSDEEENIDFPAQMYYIAPDRCNEEHYSGVDSRNSSFNTLNFEG